MPWVALIVLVAVALATVVRLLRMRASAPWWTCALLLTVLGAAVGLWSGTSCEYEVSYKQRAIGFPFKTALLERIETADGHERWRDYVADPPLTLGLDVLFFVGLALLPLSVALLTQSLSRRRKST